MTREEAIKHIQFVLNALEEKSKIAEAYRMAIKALEQAPTDDATLKDIFCMGCEYKEQGPCEDAVTLTSKQYHDLVTALEQEKGAYNALVKNVQCTDAVSRQALLEMIAKEYERTDDLDFWNRSRAKKYIEEMPSVTPQPSDLEIPNKCEDVINREDALMALTGKIPEGMTITEYIAKVSKRLRELPSVQPVGKDINVTATDAVSRQAAIEIIAETDITNGEEPVFTGKQVQALLKDLPSVTPQPKQGRWIKVVTKKEPTCEVWHYECSECGEWEYRADFEHDKYCPNCGARMQEGEE